MKFKLFPVLPFCHKKMKSWKAIFPAGYEVSRYFFNKFRFSISLRNFSGIGRQLQFF